MKNRFFQMVVSLSVFLLAVNCLPVNGQTITTIAGGATGHGGYWGEGGAATAAQLQNGPAVAVDKCGNVFIGDASRVLKVDVSTGLISTYAGTGVLGYNGDGIPATDAKLNLATWVAFDHDGNLHVGDGNNARIRKIDKLTRIISTVAGNGIPASTGDGGPATAASIYVGCFDWDDYGNMFVGDLRKLRKIDISGIISTVAGTGLSGITGEGVPATATCLGNSLGLKIDPHGNIIVVDSTNSVRKIDMATGLIYRVAGTGNNTPTPYSGDGIPATSCHINPVGIWVDDTGSIFMADISNNRIEKVDTFGIIHTVVATGIAGYFGDGGHPLTARIRNPEDVCFDICGNMYIADFGNKRIRKVTYPRGHVITPTISLSGTSFSSAGTSVTLSAAIADAGCSYVVHWLNRGVEFGTSTTPTVTYTKPTGTDTITARVVPNNALGCYDSAVSVFHLVFDDALSSTTVVANSSGISIYPNPTSNLLHITGLPGAATYRLLSMVGEVARCGELPAGGGAARLHGLPPGMYMLELVTERGERVVRRVVKE